MAAYGLGLLIIVLGLWLAALGTGWSLPYEWMNQGLNLVRISPWETMAIGILLVLLGVLLLSRREGGHELSFSVSSKLGEVRVTQDALREIISRTTLALQGVRHVESSLLQRPEGLEITVAAQFSPEVVVTEKSEEIQSAVKHDVEYYAGIRVAEVKVLVRSLETVRPARVR